MLPDDLYAGSKWLNDNKLIVNVSKSNVMVIRSKNSTIESDMCVILDDKNIEQTSSVKLLGVTIEETLNWKVHVSQVSKNISPKIGLSYRLSSFLSSSHLIQIYVATVQPIIDYAITLWGSCDKCVINLLQRMQNRCARICANNFDYSVSSATLIKQLKWMNISTRYSYFVCILMYKFVNGLLPINLDKHFRMVNQSHCYQTRAYMTNIVSLPRPHTELFKRSLSFSGPSLRNALPLNTRNIPQFYTFKKQLKAFLLSKQY